MSIDAELGRYDFALALTVAALDRGLRDACRIGHAATLMFALLHGSTVDVLCRNYAQATAGLDELAALTDESGASY